MSTALNGVSMPRKSSVASRAEFDEFNLVDRTGAQDAEIKDPVVISVFHKTEGAKPRAHKFEAPAANFVAKELSVQHVTAAVLHQPKGIHLHSREFCKFPQLRLSEVGRVAGNSN